MKKLIIIILLLPLFTQAQNTLRVVILDSDEKEPLPGTTVYIKGTTNGTSADKDGKALLNDIGNGKQVIVFSLIGFQTKIDTLFFPLKNDAFITVYLSEAGAEELETIVVSSTRSSRSISDIPTRIETVAAEELEEKGMDQPGSIKAILTESTGIQTQQTSATSANTSIRIQGLDGRYTQLLQNGFPLYSGFSEGLSIMQIPPLDLKRVEVIKGSASTLYGGGAIAGLINLITKEPTEKKELTFMANYTSANGADFSGYYNQKFKKTGITLFAAQNSQQAYDPAKIGLSAIPKYGRYTFNPRLFYYIDSTATISLGINTTFENRLGGDMQVINNKADSTHTYFERNITNRNSSQLKYEKNFKNKAILIAKNSVSLFTRSTALPNYNFAGNQTATYSEISYTLPKTKTEWVAGVNLWTDQFKETTIPVNVNKRNYTLVTAGAFLQNHWNITDKFIAESGLRTDMVNLTAPGQSGKNSIFVLPRLSLLYKLTSNFTTRLGGGLGYKAPTIFTEEAEMLNFKNIQPIAIENTRAETSIGGNFDINYKTVLFDDIAFSINEMIFYTRLDKPLELDSNTTTHISTFGNANGYLATQGSETNIKIKVENISLYGGYTFIDAQRHYNNTVSVNPLTAKHRVNITVMYEIENKIRIGCEAFFVSSQTLDNSDVTRDYWIFDFSAEKKFKHFSIFINASNFLDARQSRYQAMYTGTVQNPQFSQIWAPTDGRIINGGIKVSL